MRIREIMSRSIRSVAPTASIADAAALMADRDVGALPVIDEGRLVGIVTDRDLAVRGLGAGLHGGAPVFRVMSRDVRTCLPDDELADVLKVMADQQIRRVPVCSSAGELIGIVSISDASRNAEYSGEAAETLACICDARSRYPQARSRLGLRVESQLEGTDS